jgi:hypothetical protein
VEGENCDFAQPERWVTGGAKPFTAAVQFPRVSFSGWLTGTTLQQQRIRPMCDILAANRGSVVETAK